MESLVPKYFKEAEKSKRKEVRVSKTLIRRRLLGRVKVVDSKPMDEDEVNKFQKSLRKLQRKFKP